MLVITEHAVQQWRALQPAAAVEVPHHKVCVYSTACSASDAHGSALARLGDATLQAQPLVGLQVLATGQLAPTASFPVPTPATDGKPEADPRPKNGLTGPHALSLQGLSHVSSTQQHPEGHRSLQEGYREQQHPAAAKPAARLGPVYDLHVGGKRERSGAYEPVKRVRKPVVWEPPIGSALLGGSVGCHSHAADGALMT